MQLPRFRVSLSLEPLSSDASRTIDTVLTDANGVYRFSAVQPGQYLITARPPEHVVTHLPQMFGYDHPMPLATGTRVTSVRIRAGDVIDADIAVSRSLAIEGRVMTAEGDPLGNLTVSIEHLDRRFERPAVMTDDRGFYRHYGLSPGRYRVCATPAADRPATARRETTIRTCTDADPARAAIELTSADVDSADIVMRRERRFTVSGALFDSLGARLDRGEVSFVEAEGSPRRSLKVERPQSGRFLVRDADPGTYVLRVDVRPEPGDGIGRREFAVQEVVVDGSDISNVEVRTGRQAIVYGIVTFEGTAPEAGVDRMVVTARSEPKADPMMTFVESRKVRENLTFELPGTTEPVRLQLNEAPSGWAVKSILYRGRDIADNTAVLETSDDPRAVEVILTNRVTYLNGRATGGSANRPVVVLAFRIDKAAPTAASNSEGVPVAATVLVDEKGTFKLGPLEPGDYYVAAVDRDHWFDVSLQNRAAGIANLVARADRVSVIEGDQPPVTIRLLQVK